MLTLFTDIITKLETDLETADETWVTQAELIGLINEAVADCEKIVHTLNYEETYFRAFANIAMVTGTSLYSMPSDIYGTKILKIFYSQGGISSASGTKYEVERIRDLSDIPYVNASDLYRYLPMNNAGGPKLQLAPSSQETSADSLGVWYIRKATRCPATPSGSDYCDLPEAENYIYHHVRLNIAKKSKRVDWAAAEKEDFMAEAQNWTEAIKDMVPDGDTLIPMDLSAYSRNDYIF